MVKEDTLERAGLRELHRRAGGGDQGHTAEVAVAFQDVIDPGTEADPEAAILQEVRFLALPIFEEGAEGEAYAPIVPGYFRNAVAAAGHEPGIDVSRLRGGAELGRHSGVELAEERLRGEAEINRLGQARGGVLDIEPGAERKPVEDAVGYGGLEIESGELGPQGLVAADPARAVTGFQTKRHADPETDREIAVGSVTEDRLRQIEIGDLANDASIAAIPSRDG